MRLPLLIAALLAHLSGLAAEDAGRRTNILFLIADDWGHGHAGAYGCPWVRTPNFDRVAKEGLLFLNAYTPTAKCTPSRSTILTGRHPWLLGAAANHQCFFPPQNETFTDVLERNGYAYASCGKVWAPGQSLKADGSKFGKSESGAVWLSPALLSPYQFYPYLLKTTDADAPRFLRMLTFLPLEAVEAEVAAMSAPGYAPNSAQRRLAEEVTRFVHGEEGLSSALAATAALAPGAVTALDSAALEAADAPSTSLPRAEVVGRQLAEVVVAAGMQPSKAAVRRMIKGGGVAVNNVKVGDELREVQEEDLIDGRLMLIATGKKNKMLIRLEG
jgi:hypothetical protein